MRCRVRLDELARSNIPDVRAAARRSHDALAVAREGEAHDPLLGQVEGELAVPISGHARDTPATTNIRPTAANTGAEPNPGEAPTGIEPVYTALQAAA
jgi:hypothetical protein